MTTPRWLLPVMGRGCISTGLCGQMLFAQGGSATVTTATRNAAAGQFVASATAVKFVEWDFNNDVPVTNGQCVVVTTSINVSWDAGVNLDAGTGGGAGGGAGGGGGSDAVRVVARAAAPVAAPWTRA